MLWSSGEGMYLGDFSEGWWLLGKRLLWEDDSLPPWGSTAVSPLIINLEPTMAMTICTSICTFTAVCKHTGHLTENRDYQAESYRISKQTYMLVWDDTNETITVWGESPSLFMSLFLLLFLKCYYSWYEFSWMSRKFWVSTTFLVKKHLLYIAVLLDFLKFEINNVSDKQYQLTGTTQKI